jgi:hypothetical protein
MATPVATIDDFDLASALRAAGIAQGADALALASNITYWLTEPTPSMVCEAALERASTLAGLDEYLGAAREANEEEDPDS